MEKITFNQRFRYWFDNLMARGTGALIVGLAILSIFIIIVTTALLTLGGAMFLPYADSSMSLLDAGWESLMRTMDPGAIEGDTTWGFRLLMLIFPTLGGIFIMSTLIGVLTTGLEGKLEELQKGRSRVIEHDHTVIVGWSTQIFTIIEELITANLNRSKGAVIAVLADRDKVEMEDAIRERIPDSKNTKIICRSGNPIDLNDLEIISPHTARSIIILPPEDVNPDALVVKAVLAITNNPNRRSSPYHIVTQVHDEKTLSVLNIIGAEDTIHPVLTGDLIARVTAQTSRLSGLSMVYTELLNFGGDEIYFSEEPALVDETYGNALLKYEDSAVLGLRSADRSVILNPPMDTKIAVGDLVIALSEDDDTVRLSGLVEVPIDESVICKDGKLQKPDSEAVLILGWNRYGTTIILELDQYVTKGSRVHVIADPEISQEAAEAEGTIRRRCGRLQNQKVKFDAGDTTDRELLEATKIVDYDHVIVLSYSGIDIQAADAKTLVTLLHLRDIAESDDTPFSIVSEMLDLRNRELAEVTKVDDFIISDHLVSLMTAQLSENSDLLAVFGNIFSASGAEIYLKPISRYVEIDFPVNFYTVVEAARRRGETAFGYRLAHEADDAEKDHGVHINPTKSKLISFNEEDKVILLAEE